MISDAFAAIRQVFSPPFRAALWKVLGLTLALLMGAALVLHKLLAQQILPGDTFLALAVSFLSGLGLLIGMIFLVPPASSLVAGFFLDELAEQVEREIYPSNEVGRAPPAGQAIWLAARFALISLLVNLLALLLFLVPGINATVFIVANAYLLGREYFALAAMRYMTLDEMEHMRREHGLYLFAAGLLIALFVALPVANLVTPLFGTAFMVHVAQRLRRADAKRLTVAN